MRCFFLSAAVLLAFYACDFLDKEGGDMADETATQWAEAFFNYQYDRAARFVTPESRKWISFAASNISEQDVEILRQQENMANIILLDCVQTNESTWTATIEVNHFLVRDSLDKAGHLVDTDTEFQVDIVERDKRMFVRMEGLPQSGMRSRD